MSGYTKLFNTILASTIWRADDKTRLVWITMLAMADKRGIVEASVPGLADFARVTVTDARMALEVLSSPDEDSRSKEFEGRRIEPIDGGWLIINHAKYRAKLNADERREYNRTKQAEHRVKKSKQTSTMSMTRERSQHKAEAEADTKAEASKEPTAFGRFWSAYPRKVKKADAEKAWKTIPNGGDVCLSLMLSALSWQVGQPGWTKEGGKYVPYPAKWLRDRQWLDEPFHGPPEPPRMDAEAQTQREALRQQAEWRSLTAEQKARKLAEG